MQILARFKMVTTFVFDMDGVLTDGSIYLDNVNNWVRAMNLRDGYALQLASKSGYNISVISGSDSPAVKERMGRLGIKDVFMNVTDKPVVLKKYMNDKKLLTEEVLYMGDDIPDYFCMKMAGIAACPADAALELKEIASYISPFNGGQGCVRDVIEKTLKLNNKWSLLNHIPST